MKARGSTVRMPTPRREGDTSEAARMPRAAARAAAAAADARQVESSAQERVRGGREAGRRRRCVSAVMAHARREGRQKESSRRQTAGKEARSRGRPRERQRVAKVVEEVLAEKN